MKKIHHIGIVCNDIKDAYEAFQLKSEDIVECYIDEEQKNKLYFFQLKENDLWIEFVVPINKDSTVWRFANNNNFGLHHLGFNSRDFDKEKSKIANLKGVFELKSYFLKIASFGGKINTLFFYFRGLLIEFVKVLD
tara:strand:- start:345 stop:752 length:408 start_codon:yes stop_codon:yes gene_type:complete